MGGVVTFDHLRIRPPTYTHLAAPGSRQYRCWLGSMYVHRDWQIAVQPGLFAAGLPVEAAASRISRFPGI